MSDVALDLEIQELVFIASLYEDQSQVRRYGSVLNAQEVFQTPLAKSLWKKSWNYYAKYGAMPTDPETVERVFNSEEQEGLDAGLGVVQDTQDRAAFLRDKFMHTLDLMFLKAVHEDIGKLLTNPRLNTPDGDVILDTAMDRLMGQIVRARVSVDQLGLEVREFNQTVDMWRRGEFPAQGNMFPVAIPGMMDVKENITKVEVPIGTVNVVVASYGTGKSSVLACMAAEYLRFGDVLYVTLEIGDDAISFKMLSHVSDGLVKPEWAFKTLGDLTDSQKRDFESSVVDLSVRYGHKMFTLDAPANGLRPSEIANHITRIMAEHQVKPKIVMVDYAALLVTNHGGSRAEDGWQYVGTVITELAAIAKKNSLIIWTAAQIGGEQGHTDSVSLNDMNKVTTDFRSMRGKDLYGSKEALHNASLVFGMSIMRSADCPWVGSGVLSTWKNRYSASFSDWLVRIDYSKSRITAVSPLLARDKADVVDLVLKDLTHFVRDAEKDGKRRGLARVTANAHSKLRPVAKKNPLALSTQGHDEVEYDV